jgi:hypothetical protein
MWKKRKLPSPTQIKTLTDQSLNDARKNKKNHTMAAINITWSV